jgi:quercetin dioxygenase-like cupin family protein
MPKAKRSILLGGFACIVGVTAALATPDSGVSVTELGRGRVADPFMIEMNGPSDIIIVRGTVEPGGNTGWHSHPAPEIAVVKAGTLTYYDGMDKDCTPQPVTAGQGQFESPGHVHITRNEGSVPVEVYAAFIVPDGEKAPLRVDADRPGNCPF